MATTVTTDSEIEAFRRRCISSGAVHHMGGRELECCGQVFSGTGRRGSYRDLHRWCLRILEQTDGTTRQIVLGNPARPTLCRTDRAAVAAGLIRRAPGVVWRD
jgi:hypothetical protein